MQQYRDAVRAKRMEQRRQQLGDENEVEEPLQTVESTDSTEASRE
jgi:hypothetical protein